MLLRSSKIHILSIICVVLYTLALKFLSLRYNIMLRTRFGVFELLSSPTEVLVASLPFLDKHNK